MTFDFNSLKGINFETGMNFWEDYSDYFYILTVFANQRKNIAHDIHQLVKDGQRKKAMQLAHTIKGMSGNLYLPNVHSTALSLELTLKENDKSIEEPLENFKSAIHEAISSITKMPSQEVQTFKKKSLNSQDIEALLKQLFICFKHELIDHELNQSLQEIKIKLQGHTDDELKLLEHQTANFKFNEAQETLKLIASKLKINHHFT